MERKFRVKHFPQIPCTPFVVPVATVDEGVLIMNTLANYDIFQLMHGIKPDYSNTAVLEMHTEDGWEDWWIDDLEVGYFDDPEEYLAAISAKEQSS